MVEDTTVTLSKISNSSERFYELRSSSGFGSSLNRQAISWASAKSWVRLLYREVRVRSFKEETAIRL
jgi:hypothetical protein